MNLPGNNTLTLCGAALCAIVEKHIADSYYTKDSPVHVGSVNFDNGQYTATFALTTDKKEPANG